MCIRVPQNCPSKLPSSSPQRDKIEKAKMKAKRSFNVNGAGLPLFLKYLYILIHRDRVLGALEG